MAQGKKTFIFYTDWVNMVREMPDKDAGQLLKHVLAYVNDEHPESDNILVKMAFGHMEPLLKRDLKKWEGTLKEKSNAGQLGNLKRYYPDIYKDVTNNKITLEEGLKLAKARRASQKVADARNSDKKTRRNSQKLAVNDNDNVNVNVNDNFNVNLKETYEKCKKHFPPHLHPKNDKEVNNWLTTIKRLHEIDKVPLAAIVKITAWARQNEFWAKNFLSLTKLRKKNKEGVMYIIVFNENIKANGKQTNSTTTDEYSQFKKGVFNTLRGLQPTDNQ